MWCAVAVVDDRRRPVGVVPAADPATLLPRLVRTNAIGSPSAVLARTELVRAVGGFDEQLALLADWDLWLRLAAAGRGAASPEILAAYTEHAGGMTATASGRGRAGAGADGGQARARSSPRTAAGSAAPELARWSAGGRRRGGGRLGAARAYVATGVRERDAGSLARAPAALLGERLVGRLRARLAARGLGDLAWLEPYRREDAPASSAPIA